MSSADRPLPNDRPTGGETPSEEIRFFPPFPAWTGFDVIGIAVIFVIALIVCAVVATMLAGMLPAWQKLPAATVAQNPIVGLAAQTCAYLILFFYIARVLRQRSGESVMVAIQWNSRLGTVVMGVIGGLVLATISQLLELVLPVQKNLPMEALFRTALLAYLTSIFSVLVAPLFEEIYFRGLMFPSLREHLGEWPSIAITALAFVFLHAAQLGFSIPALIPLVVVGFALTWVRAQLKSVSASWVMHVTYNAVIVTTVWIQTGHFQQLG